MLGCALPSIAVDGHMRSMIQFPTWLGKNSTANKRQRLMRQLICHAHLNISADTQSLVMDYVPVLRERLTRPMIENDSEGVQYVFIFHIVIIFYSTSFSNFKPICLYHINKYCLDLYPIKTNMSFDLESCEHSSSSCSLDNKLPSTNNLIKGKDGQYAVGKKLAQGRYGAVYEVLRKSDGKALACKLEICEAHSHGLDMDYTIMHLAAKRGCDHLLRMIDRGKIEEHFKFIVMPLLGDNLVKLRHMFVDGRFSLSTGLRLSFLALSPIQELHNIGFVHRDIKCSNFCIAPHTSREDMRLILIDYGVCRAYKDTSGAIKPAREQVRFRGTTRYASLSAHNGEEQSPKDDLESWFYMMVELLSVKAMKEHIRTNDGSSLMFKFCPKVEFRRLQKYLDGLKYHNQPDYTYIAELVQLSMKNNGVKMDEPYDWEE
uniref:non-specific serine/threonine protein kinase n=1 Tax=Heterorhabditis bacteriophora TaxID=37862 RepID=A0A1I7XNB6_HETBA